MVFVAQRDGAARVHAAAPDRRRDDEPAAHGGEDRAGVQRTGRPRARRVARGRRRLEPAERGNEPEFDTANRATQAELREQHARAQREAAAVVSRRRAPIGCSRLGRSTHRRRRRSSAAELDDVPLEELVPFIDWTFFFAAWELKGRFPAILSTRVRRRGARLTSTRRSC